MKLTYTNTARTLTLETEVAGSSEAFETLTQFNDVFDETCCGACASVNIRFDVRRPKKDGKECKYYCIVCRDCGSRLDVSQSFDKLRLYVAHNDDAGNPLPNGGWYKYQPEGEKCTSPPPPPAQAPASKTVAGPDRQRELNGKGK